LLAAAKFNDPELTPGFGRPWKNSRLGLTVESMNYCCCWTAQAKDKAWISPPCWPIRIGLKIKYAVDTMVSEPSSERR
jgi:hypothetical protein